MQLLGDKVALVTGASRGIGEAAARALAEAGAAVVLAARSVSDCERIAAEIVAAGGAASALACDVARYADLEAAVAEATATFGGLDILVNNAGVIDPIARLEEADPDAWGQAIDINLKGVFYGLRAAIPAMRARGGGVVVNISSGAAKSALEGWSHYCASKAGAFSLTACADKELGGYGIRVVGLSPGTVATEMQRQIKVSGINPVSRLDWSDHIPAEWPGRAVAWLCTEEAADLRGTDVSLRDGAIRRRIGLG